MSIDRLVEEIRLRSEEAIRKEADRQKAEEARIVGDRDRRISAAQSESKRRAELDIARERAQKLASAKLQARKLVYEAKERQMNDSIAGTRAILANFTKSDDYPKVLKRMAATAAERLGKPTKVMGRADDAALLKKAAGANFDPTPMPILGGLVAESADGSRRLNLSFDELLRLREDKVRDLLAR
ncbi:MAG TPA: V-type ATP synthase subunit E family protein [Thermoplasmata archaeon]|jgi:V/A-type H+-transporting ATPase subunit E|nr:V-type ATP synthase subunit E family protein [Thermoplasmata archaeon]